MHGQARQFGESSLPARMAALLQDVREVGREARRLAAKRSRRGTAAYAACLARVLEEWISTNSGTRQVVCLAAAAEHGVLSARHFELASPAIRHSHDAAVRALYWATARRCRWPADVDAGASAPAEVPERWSVAQWTMSRTKPSLPSPPPLSHEWERGENKQASPDASVFFPLPMGEGPGVRGRGSIDDVANGTVVALSPAPLP